MMAGPSQHKWRLKRPLTDKEREQLERDGYLCLDVDIGTDKPSATPEQIAARPEAWE